jgi:SAM-dependent methyltransferase
MPSAVSEEARRPPRNYLGAAGGLRSTLFRRLQLFADLQVCTVRRDLGKWLAGQQGRLLEVGCGDQPYRSLVPAGCEYRGIDLQDAPREFDMSMSADVTYYSGDTFPFSDAEFDALFHSEVLEHIFNYKKFLAECRRVLRPGGKLICTVPFQARYHFVPHDYFRYTPSSLRLLLEEAGFCDIVVIPRGTDVTVAAYKAVAVFFRWAYGGYTAKTLFLLTLPLTLLLLALAHLSLCLAMGSVDDCLGYTVTAEAAVPRGSKFG